MESSQKFPLTKQIIRDLYLVFLSVQWCISTLAYGLYFICRFALKNICKFIFLVFSFFFFFHCEGICGNSLHSYKHQCIFWLSSLLVVVCTFQAEQLFVAGHRYNKMCFSQVYLPARQLFVLGQRQIEKCFPQSTVIFSCGPQRWM